MKVVILAGGKGTRLGLTDIPKPMVSICGKPLLERQIALAKRYGLQDIIIVSGFLSEVIVNHFGDGSKFGVHIQHVVEKEALGTAGAIKQLESMINEKFFVFYGDTIMDIDLERMQKFDEQYQETVGTLFVHPNNHPYDSDLIALEGEKIKTFHSKPHKEGLLLHNCVNAGLYILDPKIFQFIPEQGASDFGKDIFPQVIEQGGTLMAYKTHEYIKDIGTPDRLAQVERDLGSGKVARLNLQHQQKAIFLDRDGVINYEVDNLCKLEDFLLLPRAAEALHAINTSDFLSLIVTNQPMIAKGFLDENDLDTIHKKMETDLGKQGAYVDDIFHCPHHPDKGYAGERPELKITCSCRKPATGMIEQAVQKYHIDVSKSFIIGDSTTDIQAGKNAGLKTILVQTGYAGKDAKYDVTPDFVCKDIKEAVDLILSQN